MPQVRESPLSLFQSLHIFVLSSSLTCINEYLGVGSGGHYVIRLCAIIAVWLNDSYISRVGVRMNMSAGGPFSVKRYERSN